jgi:hypothetical protein
MSKKTPQDKAVLTIYGGKNITVNGKPGKEYQQNTGGGFFSRLLGALPSELALEPGEYTIVGDYISTSNLGKTNITAKNISLTATLQAGRNYDVGLFDSGSELEIAVAYAELDKRGWYVILRILED